MTPKEKAEELFDKFNNPDRTNYPYYSHNAQQCALISVDEIINQVYSISHQYTAIYDDNTKFWNYTESKELNFWKEVKKEIEAL